MSEFQTDQPRDEEEHAGFDGGEMESSIVASGETQGRNVPMLLVGVVLLGGAALYFMHLKSGPQQAAASVEVVNADQTISGFLNDGGSNLRQMEEMLRNTEKVVEQFTNYPSMNQIQLEDLQGNPFRFSRTPDPNAAEEAALREAQEREKEKERIKTEIARAVQQLELQSIINGAVRTCMISGRIYTEGQEVNGFEIEKINPGAVIVRKGGYRFQLTMKR